MPVLTRESIVCTMCGEEKPAPENFAVRKDRGTYESRCRPCTAKKSRDYRKRTGYKDKNWRQHVVKYKFGISEDDYNEYRNLVCQICKGPAECLDHDHKTGRLRGPLCGSCNRALGLFKDDPELLNRAEKYIRLGE